MNDVEKLTYFVAEKKSILVVSFVGPLVRSNGHILEACIVEVGQRGARWAVLNFRDVPPTVDRTILPALARLQKVIRSKPAELRMAGLHPELKKALDLHGILRPLEVANNLSDALKGAATSLQSAA